MVIFIALRAQPRRDGAVVTIKTRFGKTEEKLRLLRVSTDFCHIPQADHNHNGLVMYSTPT
jgi:hypothetical protein